MKPVGICVVGIAHQRAGTIALNPVVLLKIGELAVYLTPGQVDAVIAGLERGKAEAAEAAQSVTTESLLAEATAAGSA